MHAQVKLEPGYELHWRLHAHGRHVHGRLLVQPEPSQLALEHLRPKPRPPSSRPLPN